MPELPDLTIYLEALERCVLGERIESIHLLSPFVLRSVEPPIEAANGLTVSGLQRIGKHIILDLEADLHLVIHLMIAGRLQWKGKGKGVGGRIALAAFDFPNGTLILTEAGSKKRASIHIVQGISNLAHFDRGALEVLDATVDAFKRVLTQENHTLKRSLTDPRLFSGVGNAYSDEILHRAQLSPLKLTSRLTEGEIVRLYRSVQSTLDEWVDRLRAEAGETFPSRVTAFRPEMAVHGRYGKPCPVCASPVQRIVYAENECNYCPTCQTGGKLLADRALSRLLKEDWPRSLDEMEAHFESRR